jgi:hypothetical protein
MCKEILDDNFKKQIIFLLNNNWTGRSDYYFPPQNSVNIEKRYLFKLHTYPYFYYKKDTVNTKRAILFLFLDKNTENTAVIILKDFTMFKIDIDCSYEYYYNSIFDISYEPNSICIYDTFMISGRKINSYSFTDRISEGEIFKHSVISAGIDISVTSFTNEILSFKDNLVETEEIFIIPNDLPIITGINYACFKWKPANLITFSLLLTEDSGDIILSVTNFKKGLKFAKIHNSDPDGNKYINSIKSLENYKNGCIIDINISNKIEIVGINNFKTIPSSIRSIEKILSIKKENLKLEDLF